MSDSLALPADEAEVLPGVFIVPGRGVYIRDQEGEVACWTADEVAEDGEAFTAAVCAALLAAAYGPQAVRKNIATGGKELQALVRHTAFLQKFLSP